MARRLICSKDQLGYLDAFAGAVYQNPKPICPRHQMLLPRIIKGRGRLKVAQAHLLNLNIR